MLLGHASVQTTKRYVGTKQDLIHAPNDAIRLRDQLLLFVNRVDIGRFAIWTDPLRGGGHNLAVF